MADKSAQVISIGGSFEDDENFSHIMQSSWISHELCDWMRFLPDYAKSHNCILSEALPSSLWMAENQSFACHSNKEVAFQQNEILRRVLYFKQRMSMVPVGYLV